MQFPKRLHNKLLARKEDNSFRELLIKKDSVDFSSNDYLGFAKSEAIFEKAHQFLVENNLKKNGSTGSRLLSGNSILSKNLEDFLADYHNTETATIFNSGYTANLGFFGAIPQRGDIILYDEFIHASIREGIRLSNAKAFKFSHNNLESLDEMLKRVQHNNSVVYVVTESVFSMDGDSPELEKMSAICKKYNAFFVVDEAHAVGVFGEKGKGLVQKLQLEKDIFARIVTFGKAIGCHGAVVLGSKPLKEYLVNFARSFIYTTALSPHSLATIQTAYNELARLFDSAQGDRLKENIHHFLEEVKQNKLESFFINSNSAIHCCVVSGNGKVKEMSNQLQKKGFDVKAVLSPTVPKGKERLRFCLHSYNTKEEITQVLALLGKFVIG